MTAARTTASSRVCPRCRQGLPLERFKHVGNGLHERHCLECRWERGVHAEKLRRSRWKGVDIDRIHYLRGAVKIKKAA